MKIFKNNSDPLVEVLSTQFVDGEIYVTDEGMRIMYIAKEHTFDVIQHSVLNLGENIEDLTYGKKNSGLELYWRLMNKAAETTNL